MGFKIKKKNPKIYLSSVDWTGLCCTYFYLVEEKKKNTIMNWAVNLIRESIAANLSRNDL